MGRVANLSPLGLYTWDNTVFDLMRIPEELDKETLVQNLLAETAELEVLYPNPVVFKNLVGVWSNKQIDIWNRLYATTQYEYNPIENYNRYETGSDTGTGGTHRSSTNTTADHTEHGGSDTRTENLTTSGIDTVDMSRREGGTEGKTGTIGVEQGGNESKSGTGSVEYGGSDIVNTEKEEGGTETEATTSSVELGGRDITTGTDTKGHWIAGFDSSPVSASDDGLVKQTRDQDDATTTTTYGKTEDGTGSKTTTFGKTNTDEETTTYGKTEDTETSETIRFGKTEDTETEETITFGKTETNQDKTTYGKNENVRENKAYGETVDRRLDSTIGEQTITENNGSHELHAHGNIGVTTTQKLIREQRSIDLFNLYDIIIEDFKMRFCILVY